MKPVIYRLQFRYIVKLLKNHSTVTEDVVGGTESVGVEVAIKTVVFSVMDYVKVTKCDELVIHES